MNEIILWIILAVTAVTAILAVVSLIRAAKVSEGFGREVRDELRTGLQTGREEARSAGRELREEVAGGLKSTNEVLANTLERLGKMQQAQLEGMTKQLQDLTASNQAGLERIRGTFDARVKELQEGNEKKLDEMRKTLEQKLQETREGVSGGLKSTNEVLSQNLGNLGKLQQGQLEGMTKQLKELTESNQGALDRVRHTFDSRVKELQEGNEKKLEEMRKTVEQKLHETREEVSGGLKSSNEVLSQNLGNLGKLQQGQLEGMTKQLKELTESNQGALDRVRHTFDSRVKELQEGNEKKLEEMRKTVDEKLHDTLEKRLGESFKLVSERLEAVHQGLGEMQNLAAGVGDLKKVLVNVKTRGTLGEVQLGAILEQILAPEQFEKNVRVKPGTLEAVEYAIRLPGPRDDPGACVWLPIDSKFPLEDYLRLQEAAEKADSAAVQAITNKLTQTVRTTAKTIRDKYISPPGTTDFAIMFLATEGLYAEVLRHPGLVEDLQRHYRVMVAGPTTLAAILSSLRLGFQTLAIEQRSAEVWRILGAVKTEFGKFGEVLTKVKRQIDTASRTIDETGRRTRAMAKTLRSVEQLPEPEALEVLALPAAGEEDDADEAAAEASPAP